MATQNVEFKINAVDNASKVLNGVRNTIKSVSGSMLNWANPLKRIGSLVTELGNKFKWLGLIALGAVSAGLFKVGRGILDATMQAQDFAARLATVGGDRAGGLWAWAKDFAKTTPYELSEVIDAMTRMMAYKIEPTTSLKSIGDFGAAMGRSMTDTVEMVADAVMGEWERAKEFGLKRSIVEDWAKGKGFNPFNAQGTIIDAAGAQKALFGIMSERGMGGMARKMDTIAGKWSNFQDAVWNLYVTIGEKLAPALGKIVDMMTNLVNTLGQTDLVKKIVWAFAVLISSAENAFKNIQNFGILTQNLIKQVLDFTVSYVASLVPRLLGKLYGGVSSGLDWLSKQASKLGLAGFIPKMLLTGWSKLFDLASQAGNPIGDIMASNIPGIKLPEFYNTNRAQELYNQMMSSSIGNIVSNTAQTAQNTATIAAQNQQVLEQIYGGGARTRAAASRFAFGGGIRPLITAKVIR